MTYQNIVKYHAALCALNADNPPPPLHAIGLRQPSGSREQRRKTKGRLKTVTPKIIVARIKEYQRRRTPAQAPTGGAKKTPIQMQWGVGAGNIASFIPSYT